MNQVKHRRVVDHIARISVAIARGVRIAFASSVDPADPLHDSSKASLALTMSPIALEERQE